MANVYGPYSTLNTEGVNIEETYPPASNTPYVEVPPFALGQVVQGTDEGQWVFSIAAATIAAGDVLAINPSTFSASLIINGSALGSTVGVAPVAVASGSSFWAQVNGYAPLVRASAASLVVDANGRLHTSATGGAITATASAGVSKAITGIIWQTAPSGAGTFPAVLDSPLITQLDP